LFIVLPPDSVFPEKLESDIIFVVSDLTQNQAMDCQFIAKFALDEDFYYGTVRAKRGQSVIQRAGPVRDPNPK